jgi:hypothetical protein
VRVRVRPEIRADHDDVRRLVVDGFHGVGEQGVEVVVERARSTRESFTGRAYFVLPSRPEPHPDTKYLVKLKIPGTPRNRAYPKTYRYWNRTTAPWITVGDWRERLVALAAHEACHVRQFRGGLRRSEVEAERWAARILDAWRARGGQPVPVGEEVWTPAIRVAQLALPFGESAASAAAGRRRRRTP